MAFLFRILSWFPLWLLHGMGAVLGWLGWFAAASYRRRVRDNAALAGLTLADVRPSIAHNGRMLSELPRLWLGKPVHCEWRGLEHVEQAYGAGKGIIFLTPHMGWNSLITRDSALMDAGDSPYVYFVHSYHAAGVPEDYIIAEADYGYRFTAAVCRDNVFGLQFHPEKSGDAGLAMLRRFGGLS